MKLQKEEQEVTYTFTMADIEATLFTSCPKLWQEYEKLCEKYPDHYHLLLSDQYSRTFGAPMFMKPFVPRHLTDEQRGNKGGTKQLS
jgi:hypothetical protein